MSIKVDRRSTRQTALATDPLSVVTLLILMASALVAIVLGACAVLFGAAADASDDRPLLRMLALERVDGSATGRDGRREIAGRGVPGAAARAHRRSLVAADRDPTGCRFGDIGQPESAAAPCRSRGSRGRAVDRSARRAWRSAQWSARRRPVMSPTKICCVVRRDDHFASADEPVIDIEDAFVLHRGRTHDVAALRGLSLRVDPGERIVVRGPSGARANRRWSPP